MSESNDNIQTAPQESNEYTSEDVVAQYWQAGCAAYRQAIERAESAEQTDDIKPIATSAPYRSFASTRIGGRKENQDTAAFRETPDGMLLIVCDGMGGGPAGKRASLLAAHVISEYVARNAGSTDDRNLLTDALQLAHAVLQYDARVNPQNHGMGTTAAIMLINGDCATMAHVGDSRIYHIRGQRMLFRTRDHSLVARRMELDGWTDEEARTSSDSNVITQALGHAEIEPEIDIRPYVKGDRFLLCSDGIWGHFPQDDLMKIAGGASTPGGALADLMVTADTIGIDEGNTHDNLTAIILETDTNSKLEDKMTKKSKRIILILGILLLCSLALNAIQLAKSGKATEESNSGVENVTSPQTETTHDPAPEQQTKSITAPEAAAVSAPSPAPTKTDTIYIIKSGDAISRIAGKFKVTVEEIKQANPSINLDRIKPGQTLTIPLKQPDKK